MAKTRRDEERDQAPSALASSAEPPPRDDLDDLVTQALAAAPWRGIVYAIVYAFRRLAVTAFAAPYLLITGYTGWTAFAFIALALFLDLYIAPRHAVDLRDGGRDYLARILTEHLTSYGQETSALWDKVLRIILIFIGSYYAIIVLPYIVSKPNYLNDLEQGSAILGDVAASGPPFWSSCYCIARSQFIHAEG